MTSYVMESVFDANGKATGEVRLRAREEKDERLVKTAFMAQMQYLGNKDQEIQRLERDLFLARLQHKAAKNTEIPMQTHPET